MVGPMFYTELNVLFSDSYLFCQQLRIWELTKEVHTFGALCRMNVSYQCGLSDVLSGENSSCTLFHNLHADVLCYTRKRLLSKSIKSLRKNSFYTS